MKQTNNALKFLLAQYRAIFKNAYFKGIASAVLLTAGLASGAAQADNYDHTSFPNIGTESVTWNSGSDTIKITDAAAADGLVNNTNAFEIVVGSSGNKIDVSTAPSTATSGVTVNALNGSITLSGATAAFDIKGGTSDTATLNIKSFSVESGSLSVSGGSSSGNAALNASTFNLSSGTVTLTGSTSASATLSGGTITLGSADAANTKISFAGADSAAGANTILQGRLTSTSSGGILDFSAGFGTLKTYTDDAGVTANITVGTGKGATLDLSDYDEDASKQTLKLVGGTVNLNNHNTAGSGGALTITYGTLEIGDTVTLQSSGANTSGAGRIVLSGSSADVATLKLSSDKLKKFFSGDGTNTQAGAVDLTKGTLFLTDNVDLKDFTYSTTAGTAGAINANSTAGTSIIAGDELTLTGEITNGSNFYVEANTLNLTEISDADNAYGIGKTTAATYNLTLNTQAATDGTAADNAFTVNHDMVYAVTQDVTNPYQVQGADPADPTTITVAGKGTIGSNLLVTSDSGSVTVAAGHYTTANDIELADSGSLTVGGQANDFKGVDASLTLQNGTTLLLNNSGSNATEITISGNAAGTEWSDGITHTPTAVLDLTQGSVQFAYDDNATTSDTYEATAKINVASHGELILRDDQFNYLLNNLREIEKHNAAVSGAALNLSGGTITVEGDVDIDISTISNTANSDSKLNFTTTGGTLAADTITITEADQDPTVFTDVGTPLNLGSTEGKLQAETINLHNHSINATNDNYVDYQITTGTIEVGSAFNSDNPTVIFGDGSSGANLTLGYVTENVDDYGIGLKTYTTSAATGKVNTNIKLYGGADLAKSALTVNFGDWTINDLEASNATITVGQIAAVDADGNPYAASLTGKALKLNTGATMTVESSATATFDTLNLAGGSATVNNTTMTINGQQTGSEANGDLSYGLTVTNGTITVNGREGVLALGEVAVSGIDATKTSSNNVTTYNITGLDGLNGFVTLKDYATLSLAFDSSDVFGEESLEALRQAFISGSKGSALTTGGFIDIGAATVDGIVVTNNQISWNDLEQYKDIIADIINQDTKNATLIDVNAADTVQANVGNVLADGATPVVNFSDSTLHNGANGFVNNENGTPVTSNVISGAHLGLYNGGTIGAVTLEQGTATSDTELAVIASAAEDGTEPTTTIASVDGKGYANTSFVVQGATEVTGKVDVGSLVVDKALTIGGEAYATGGLYSTENEDGTLVTTGDLKVTTLEVDNGANYGGNITATGAVRFGGINPVSEDELYYLAGNNTFTDVAFNQDTELDKGTTTADTVTVGDSLAVYGGATLDAGVLQFSTANNTKYLQVGMDAGSDEEAGETWESSAGYLSLDRLDLNGGVLLVDPDYEKPASMVAVDRFGAAVTTPENDVDAGTVNGNLIALRNSVLAIGVSDSNPDDEATVFDEIRSTFSNYFDANGSLSNADGRVGTIAYVADNVTFDANSVLVLNANMDATRYKALNNGTATNVTAEETAFQNAISANKFYLGANTALAISDVALNKVTTVTNGDGTTTTTPIAAVHFETNNASVFGDGGKIVLVGTNFDPNKEVMLFSDNDTAEGQSGVEIAADGQDIQVESLSGIYVMTLEAGTTTTATKLTVDNAALQEAWYAASDPVADLLDNYVSNRGTSGLVSSKSLLGERASGIRYNADTNTFTDSNNATVQGYVAVANDDGSYTVYHAAANDLLTYTTVTDNSGATAETAARLGAYAGVAQAALAAGASTYDAISGRMGIGADASAMTFADNGQGAGLWVTPIYKNQDSDGFDADGVDYGVDMDIYGVALGADYTLGNGLRVGAMFNIGSGDADGQGAGSAASNDFDYYGFGLYAGYTMGQFSVVGDVTYTAVDNDVEATLGSFDKVGASLDSTNLSVGVTGKYEFDFDGLYVTPHAGLRYSSIDIDDYDVAGEEVYAHFNADSIDVFSIPVGVTVAKEITAGSWTVKPAFDVTLTGNFGDDSFDGDVNWAGISNVTTATSTEVIDNFTYGATLGVGAKTGNFSLGLGVNYTGSSNVDEFGVNANARYVF